LKSSQCSGLSIPTNNVDYDPFDSIQIDVVPFEAEPFSASVCLEIVAAELVTAVRNGLVKSFNMSWDGGKHIKVIKTIDARISDTELFELTLTSEREIL
jgi:hypothetical protein